MKKQEPKTDFNFSFANLEQLGDKAVDLIVRDAAELVDYGVDTAYKDALELTVQNLKDFPTDEELQGVATIATEQKDAAADAFRTGVRSIMVRVKQVFKSGSATYNRFGTKGLDDMTDNELVRCGGRVSRMATQYLTELAAKGLTAGMITDLDALTDALDDAIDTQDEAIRARNVGTQERIELANGLYAKIVEVFDFGKDYWFSRNEAKYNDYIIYNEPGGGANPPETVVTGMVAPMTTENVATGIDAKATIRVKNIGSIPFMVCNSAGPSDPCMDGQTLNPDEEMETTGGLATTPDLLPNLNISNTHPDQEAHYEIGIS